MKCCSQCAGLEQVFDDRTAQDDLKAYRRNGPDTTTQMLLDAITVNGVQGMTLLDIGGGVGAILHPLLKAGITQAVGVDASASYIRASQQEAERLGNSDKVTYHHGDFVSLAPQIEAADIVTLDRVVCCYPDMPALVGLSVDRARRYYGLVYPIDRLPYKLALPIVNGYFRLVRNPYRMFLHSTREVQALVEGRGFQSIYEHRGVLWQVSVYERM